MPGRSNARLTDWVNAAGNAALEEVVMALRTRQDYFDVSTNINSAKLYPTSRLVSNITGMAVQRNKAIVGQNAFAHEAGIHQHGILQERTTYEIMRPQDVGFVGQNLVLGKHSGRHAFRDRVETLGYQLSDEDFQLVFKAFIDLADKKKEIYDADIVALVENQSGATVEQHWKIRNFHTLGGTGTIPTATLSWNTKTERLCRMLPRVMVRSMRPLSAWNELLGSQQY